MTVHPTVAQVTERIIARSRGTRQAYLALIARQREEGVHRPQLSCGNLAHGFAASGEDKPTIRKGRAMNIGIITAYNDMLSAHQPYGRYPEQIKLYAREVGATAQIAGAVPAMCDGVTQGQAGMELSLFSRDVIAMASAVGLSHGMFEGVLLLGICDKIVPGLLIGGLCFGHLPMILIPSGPMPSGLANEEKTRVRKLHATGAASAEELLEVESASYHGPGTCTFYGTANSNQMMMEMMGLHIPGSSFVNPGSSLRRALTRAAVHRVTEIGWTNPKTNPKTNQNQPDNQPDNSDIIGAGIAKDNADYRPLGLCVDEKALVNAIVGLLATGGSTNHLIHLPAIARAAGIVLDWDDMDILSTVVPLIASIYPNGAGDVNYFAAAGGMPFVIRELLDNGLAHGDIRTVYGASLAEGAAQPIWQEDKLSFVAPPQASRNPDILRSVATPFQTNGGLKLLRGNLGRATIKVSALKSEHRTIEAAARIFDNQQDVIAAFRVGKLDSDAVIVVRFQGPAANGMPELHQLTAPLGVLQDRGYKIALVTDGRMSGASGRIAAAIHVSPEAWHDGPLGKLREGDRVRLCAESGTLSALVEDSIWQARTQAIAPSFQSGTGRELFTMLRRHCDSAEHGGSAMLREAGL